MSEKIDLTLKRLRMDWLGGKCADEAPDSLCAGTLPPK